MTAHEDFIEHDFEAMETDDPTYKHYQKVEKRENYTITTHVTFQWPDHHARIFCEVSCNGRTSMRIPMITEDLALLIIHQLHELEDNS